MFNRRCGNGLFWDEGGELINVYREMMDKKGAERKDTLIVPYNKVINADLGRPYLVNRTLTKNSVKMVMMSGREFEVSLAYVETYADIISAVFQFLTPERGIRTSILDGERVLSSSRPRLILTDDSLLTSV